MKRFYERAEELPTRRWGAKRIYGYWVFFLWIKVLWILWVYNGYGSNRKALWGSTGQQRGGSFCGGFIIARSLNNLSTPSALPMKGSPHLWGHSISCGFNKVLFPRQKVQFGLRESLKILRDSRWSWNIGATTERLYGSTESLGFSTN